MSKLVIIAHPDDETLFFSSILDKSTKVICVTDANADGRGKEREAEFARALAMYDVQDYEMWDFEDIYEKRLPIKELVFKLKRFQADQIYTHAPIGEYGHPHHQDVSRAVYEVFDADKIFIPAFNAFPSQVNQISKEDFIKKTKVLTEVYGKETSRFLNLIPATSVETFMQMEQDEVVNVYNYLTGVTDTIESTTYIMHSEVLKSAYKDRKRTF